MAADPASEAVTRLRLLSEAAQDLLAADDPDRMLQGLFRRASQQLAIDAYFNFMVDPDGKALRLASCAGVPASVVRDLRRLDFGQAVCGTVAATGEPMVATHIQDSDDPLTALVRGLGIRAYACNPLRVGDRVLGTLSFGSRTCDRFGEEDLELFRAICRCVTSAYERLRSEAALRESERALRQSRRQLIEQMRQLEEQDRRKDEFLAVLGHELRNPLAALWSGVDALRQGVDPALASQMTGRMATQMSHLRRLVDDLLDLSRISRGKVKLRRKPCELGAIVERSVASLRAQLDERGQALELSGFGGIHVEADADRLEQVMTNLLDNAIRHTPEGGAIRVELEAEASWVTLRVRDEGRGVAPELRERIFEPFAQEASEARGLGLGLAVVRQVVELHGGRVWVESAGPGQGSEFVCRIPGACDPPVGAEAAASDLGPSPPPDPDGEPGRPRVLIVDDNGDAAFALALLLRRKGFDTLVCHSGKDASLLARTERPHVVVLDIGLPDGDGCEIARNLRADGSLADLRLIALTGYGDGPTARRVAEAGFDGMLLKPADMEALVRLLRGGRQPNAA